MLCLQPVLGRLTILRHHDDGRLDRSDHRKDEIEKNTRVGIEWAGCQHDGIQHNPGGEKRSEDHVECP